MDAEPVDLPLLSVVMPCYNEAATIEIIVKRVLDSEFAVQLVIVDDGSSDGTKRILDGFTDPRIIVHHQKQNQGKGAAVRKGFELAAAPYVIIQDADLEYDPAEYVSILQPLIDDDADVVYGSRFLSGRPKRVHMYWHSVGNRCLTTLSNMFTNLNLTDMETCYKAFRLEVVKSLELKEDRFGIEPEMTAKVAAGGWRVWEVGISYAGRSYGDGKKIGWKDGVRALICILKYSPLVRRNDVRSPAEPAAFEEADQNLDEMLDSLAGAENYLDFLSELMEPYYVAPILEVGAGHGDLTERMSHVGAIHATDLSQRCLAILEERFADNSSITVDRLDLDAAFPAGEPYEHAANGSIVMINVLEHIGDDVAALRRLAETLKPGGVVIVYVPAFDMLYGRFDRLIGHHRRYRLASLSEAFVEAGLTPVEVRYVNLPGWFAWLLTVRFLRLIPSNGPLVHVYDRFVIPAVRLVERRIRPPFGQSVLGVARR